MKLPGLMSKAKYQRFHIEPRYYDPVKEDIENRTSRIKSELELTEGKADFGYRSQIEGSFRKNMKHATGGGVDQTVVVRLLIMVILVTMVGGFVYVGMEIFYLLLLLVPFYLWRRIKR